jgi:hypothetical protein
MNALENSLSKGERRLVRATKRAQLDGLDEDDLVNLHRRVRRARNKYAQVYRRAASAGVVEQGGRGVAQPKNRRNAGKAEVFEDALARVSRRLAVVARQTANELKVERLALARQDGAGPAAGTGGRGAEPASAARRKGARKSPGKKKRDASTLAAGARRQAKRDSS